MNKKSIVKVVKAFSPAFLWAALIFTLSSQEMLPGLTLSVPDFILKKMGHIFVYAVLYILMMRGFEEIGYSISKSWKTAMVICLLYAITDELHQSTVPGRTGTAKDVGFDFLGISLAFLKRFKYI